jgi:hypothetical protein
LSLSTEKRGLAFEQAAAGLAGQAVILEKDFWVSWLLGLLFAQPELAPFLVFKGGTSLSKVFGVIDRFSEDIDLCLVPNFVGADAQGFDALTSRVKRDAAVLEMQRLCAEKVQQVVLPALFGDWHCEVVALELQRTFWEKATILHSEYHRPADSPTPDRYARHYFDMARLLAHADAPLFWADTAQCMRVVDWKSRVFARGCARYDLAQQGTFRLLPPAARQAALARDYATMRPMFMSEPPSFEVLMSTLAQAEKVINKL